MDAGGGGAAAVVAQARAAADELADASDRFHAQRLSIAMHVAAAEEILDTVLLDGAMAAQTNAA